MCHEFGADSRAKLKLVNSVVAKRRVRKPRTCTVTGGENLRLAVAELVTSGGDLKPSQLRDILLSGGGLTLGEK